METPNKEKRAYMSSINRVISFHMSYVKNELKGKEINFNDWIMILSIGDYEGCSIKDLCFGLCIDKSQGTRVVKKLIDSDFIKNCSTGKKYSLYLTEKGRITYAYCDIIYDKLQSIIYKDVKDEDIDTILNFSNSINERLEKYYKY